jgi:hypothetical protein
MSKLSIRSVLAATFIVVGMTSVGLAQAYSDGDREDRRDRGDRREPHAPEIDAASATTALALLAGGLLIIRGRRR